LISADFTLDFQKEKSESSVNSYERLLLMRNLLIVLGVLGGLVVVGFIGCSLLVVSAVNHGNAAVAAVPAADAPAAVPAEDKKKTYREDELKRLEPMQTYRGNLIQALMKDGTIDKLEFEGQTGVFTVGPQFVAATFDAKKNMADTAFAWCRCAALKQGVDCDLMIIQDTANHHKIGKYGKLTGFSME
jgi:hypothetical protein